MDFNKKYSFRQWVKIYKTIDEDEFVTLKEHIRMGMYLLASDGFGYYSDDYLDTYQVYKAAITVWMVILWMHSQVTFMFNNPSYFDMVIELINVFAGNFIHMIFVISTLVNIKNFKAMFSMSAKFYDDMKEERGKTWEITNGWVKFAAGWSRLFNVFTFSTLPMLVIEMLYSADTNKPLLEPVGLFFLPIDISPYYELTLFFQLWDVYFLTSIFSCAIWIALHMLFVICAQLDCLAYMFNDITDLCTKQYEGKYYNDYTHDERNLLDAKLRKCVNLHQLVYQTSDLYNKCYRNYSFFLLSSATMIFVGSLYMFTETETGITIKFATYTSSFFGEVALFCIIADSINTKCSTVAETVYNCPWHIFHKSHQISTQIILMRAQRPVVISGVFTDLSLPTLVALIKGVYSYYTVLTAK